MLQRALDSWLVFYGATALTFGIVGAFTALIIVDAVTLDLRERSWRGTAISAAIFDALGLVSIALLALCRLGCSGIWWHRWVLPGICLLIAFTGLALSVSALVLKAMQNVEVSQQQGGRNDSVAQFVLCAASFAAQLIFYLMIALKRETTKAAAPKVYNEKRAVQEHSTALTRPMALRIVVPQSDLGPLTPSPLPRRFSWTDQLTLLRASNSHRELLGSRSSLSRASSIQSADTLRSDPFDSWHISTPILDNTTSTMPSTGTRLETIADSRPTSPAKALDGPYPGTPDAQDDVAGGSGHVLTPVAQNPSQSQRAKRTFVPASRPLSPGSDESYIHPLFRTDSPTPPPSVSRDTVVTASPIAGQVLSSPVLSRPVSRKASASQLSSWTTSRAPSRANSMDELPMSARRVQSIDEQRWLPSNTVHTPTSPSLCPGLLINANLSLENKAQTGNEDAGESESPITRGLTPPIPEFILSAKQERPRSKSSKETLKSSPPRG